MNVVHSRFVTLEETGDDKLETPFEEITIGKEDKFVGNEVAILTIGHPGNFATQAREKMEQNGYSIAQYDMRFVKPR